MNCLLELDSSPFLDNSAPSITLTWTWRQSCAWSQPRRLWQPRGRLLMQSTWCLCCRYLFTSPPSPLVGTVQLFYQHSCSDSHCTALHCTLHYTSMMHCTKLIVMFCAVLYYTVLFCTALYCIALYWLHRVRLYLRSSTCTVLFSLLSCICHLSLSLSPPLSLYLIPSYTSHFTRTFLQAELDEMSGILHCEEEDNLTAYSYFLEVSECWE